MSILIYGAYGYTGQLIVTEALARGHRPILAGRDREKTRALATEHGLEHRVFAIDDTRATRSALDGVDVVLHAAGPFSITSQPMVDACLASGASYLDITGEIDVFEAIYARHDEAVRERVALIPGVGFDVVPTDCLARMLKEALPDATHLELAFRSKGGASRGTARTAVLGLGTGGRERREGRIIDVAPALHVKTIPFPRGPRTAMSIPWGDISSAFRTTEIPNIVTFMSASESTAKNTQRAAAFAFLAKNRLVTRALLALVDRSVRGPDDDTRAKGFVEVWGEVRNAAGSRVSGTMLVPEVYTFTGLAAVRAIEHIVAHRPIGALTPALAFGAAFVTTIPGVEVGVLAKSA